MWRKSPPTIEEIHLCQYWWNRSTGDDIAHVLSFDIDEVFNKITIFCDDDVFIPSDWGEEWAPCIPPI